MRIALIGNRLLEQDLKYSDDAKLYYRVCYRLATLGITFTSGLASAGCDAIAQRAYSQAVQDGKATTAQFEVYVASQSLIDKSILPNANLSLIAPKECIEACDILCGLLHPAWDKCNEYAKSQHRRNCHQVLGYDLNNPVDAMICWTVDGIPRGGSLTAINLAISNDIPVFNLGSKDKNKVLNDIKDFLEKSK